MSQRTNEEMQKDKATNKEEDKVDAHLPKGIKFHSAVTNISTI